MRSQVNLFPDCIARIVSQLQNHFLILSFPLPLSVILIVWRAWGLSCILQILEADMGAAQFALSHFGKALPYFGQNQNHSQSLHYFDSGFGLNLNQTQTPTIIIFLQYR